MDHRGLNTPPFKKSTTLIELIIAIALMSIIILTLSSLDLFGRLSVLNVERTAKLQHEVSYTLEHMSRNIAMAIGSFNSPAIITLNPIGNTQQWIKIRWDRNGNGQPDDDGGTDWIAYRYLVAPDYQIIYNNQYPSPVNAIPWPPRPGEIIARRITVFRADYNPNTNFVAVQITACWDPAGALGVCGSPDNPAVRMSNSINMPSVSAN